MVSQQPVEVRTMVDVLVDRAATQGDRVGYTFLESFDDVAGSGGGRGVDEVPLTYVELDEWARAIAVVLDEQVGRGDRVLLLFPSGLDYIAAFFGCLYAGVVAVPVYPPRIGTRFEARDLARTQAIAANAGAAAVLTVALVRDLAAALLPAVPDLAHVPWVVTDADDLGTGAARRARGEAWRHPGTGRDDLAFLQYTSGSTGTPRGVMVCHGNLIDNQAMIQHGTRYGPDDCMVSWLPLYHDLGLIGATLQPCYVGFPCVFMGPEKFLARPARWVEAVSRHRGTTGGGPNFAYELTARRTPPEVVASLDLSSWTVAYNGGEAVRADTLERFVEVFGPAGFTPSSWFPVYGLAEATVYVAGGPLRRGAAVVPVSVAALEAGRVEPGAPGVPGTRSLVGSTLSEIDQDARIVDPETGVECPPGTVGELWLAGPHICDGYWNDPEGSASSFGARLGGDPDAGPFLRTGDLAFLDDGEVVICGRRKDLIIVDGRNHHPHDIERTAEEADPACRPGGAIAFSVERPSGDEGLVVVQEVRDDLDADEVEAVALRVRAAVASAHDVRPHDIVLVRARSVPKTSSGKVQRGQGRRQYLDGTLDRIEPAADPSVAVPGPVPG